MAMKKVKIIVAVSDNNAIGKDNQLLFRLKDDLRNFSRLTTGNVVIMGRKTYESIGKPLPNRINIVVTRSGKEIDGCTTVGSLEEAVRRASEEHDGKEIYVIGGGTIYKEAFDNGYADTVYLTRVKSTVDDADTYFPALDYYKEWRITEVDSFKDEKTRLEYDICTVRRRN